MNREEIFNAELERWSKLEAKVKEAIDLSSGLRYNGPLKKLKEALEAIQGFRDGVKALHDEMRKH